MCSSIRIVDEKGEFGVILYCSYLRIVGEQYGFRGGVRCVDEARPAKAPVRIRNMVPRFQPA